MTIWLQEACLYMLIKRTLCIISLSLFLFCSLAFAVEIEIRPVLEGQEYYIMKLGQTQTFEASGLGWDKEKQEKTRNVEIKAVRWTFDARFLKLVGRKNKTITLKAIKKRTNKLTVTGKIGNKYATKTIFIVVK